MQTWKPDKPFNGLPLLPPKGDMESRTILKACIEARASLAQIREASHLLPNPSMLINTIPLLEAKSSSEIENIVTTSDKLFLYVDHQENADPETKEALRYRTALYQGFRDIKQRPLSKKTAIDICQIILGIDVSVRKTPGTKLIHDRNQETIYTPPEGEDLLWDLLSNLEAFIYEENGLDPLIVMAMMHYQFEAIHPFSDGNGRTGRILNILFLIQKDLLDLPILYLSRFIISHKQEYYSLLLKVTSEQAWEDWICFMLHAVKETADWTIDQVKKIRDLLHKTVERIRVSLPKMYSKELVELLFIQPYCKISHLVEAGIGHRQTASNYLKQLSKLGILQEIVVGREKIFIHTELMDLLTNHQ